MIYLHINKNASKKKICEPIVLELGACKCATGRGRFYVLGNQIVNGLDPPVVSSEATVQ